MNAKRQEKVEKYQEYMRKSEDPKVLGSIVTVLGLYQVLIEFTASIEDDILPAQRKSIKALQDKLKPSLQKLEGLEESYPYYSDMINDLVDQLTKYQNKLEKHYKEQEEVSHAA